MDEFWYQIENKTVGPVNFSELLSLKKKGLINRQTKCLKEGARNWETVAEIINSQSQTKNSKVNEFKAAGVWRRFFARAFDINYEILTVYYVLGPLLVRVWHGFPKFMESPGSSAVFWMFCLPFVLVLDSTIFKLFGNTIGKMWLGLCVVNEENKKISAGEYFRRNFSLWKWGFAFGFPLITFLALLYQGNRMSKGAPAMHDQLRGTRVMYFSKGWFRQIIFVIAFLFLAIIRTLLN